MNNFRRTIVVVLGILGLLVLMVAASRVGGIAIRSDFTNADLTTLSVSTPALRGVPVLVRWESDATLPILALWRDADGDQVIGVGNVRDAGVRVEFPCQSAGTTGSVVIIDPATQHVLGQAAVDVLPAGADCALR